MYLLRAGPSQRCFREIRIQLMIFPPAFPRQPKRWRWLRMVLSADVVSHLASSLRGAEMGDI